MIDLHAHILPGVDDGSSNWNDTLLMASRAEEDQIERMAATPHANPDYHQVPAEIVMDLVDQLNAKIKEKGIQIQILAGHDAHLVPELLPKLKRSEILTLNESRYFLLEPPEFFESGELKTAVFQFMMEGYIPIVTHPERIGMFHRHPELIPSLIEQGALMQVTAGSVTGHFGEQVVEYSRWMFDKQYVHVLATDAHSPEHRPPVLSVAVERLKEWKIDPEPFVETNPAAILRDGEVEIRLPDRKKPKYSFLGRFLKR